MTLATPATGPFQRSVKARGFGCIDPVSPKSHEESDTDPIRHYFVIAFL
jgi:hypothetical protein